MLCISLRFDRINMVVINRVGRMTFLQSQESKNSLKKGYTEITDFNFLKTLRSILGRSLLSATYS